MAWPRQGIQLAQPGRLVANMVVKATLSIPHTAYQPPAATAGLAECPPSKEQEWHTQPKVMMGRHGIIRVPARLQHVLQQGRSESMKRKKNGFLCYGFEHTGEQSPWFLSIFKDTGFPGPWRERDGKAKIQLVSWHFESPARFF